MDWAHLLVQVSAIVGSTMVVLKALDRLIPKRFTAAEREILERIEKNTAMAVQLVYALLDNDGTPHFHADSSGAVLWSNAKFADVTGLRREQTLDAGWVNAIDFPERRVTVQEWYLAIKDQRSFYHECTFKHLLTGDKIPVTLQATPLIVNRRLLGYLCAVRERESEST